MDPLYKELLERVSSEWIDNNDHGDWCWYCSNYQHTIKPSHEEGCLHIKAKLKLESIKLEGKAE